MGEKEEEKVKKKRKTHKDKNANSVVSFFLFEGLFLGSRLRRLHFDSFR